jgi:hypothetical protein
MPKKMIVFRHSNPELKLKHLLNTQDITKHIQTQIESYISSLTYTEDISRVSTIDPVSLAEDINFFLSTQPDTYLPIQQYISAIASFITDSNDTEKIVSSHITAGEILFHLTPLVQLEKTHMGHIRVKSNISDKEIQFKYLYPLPENEPTNKHDALGKYKWTITNKDALDMLNQTAMTILDIPEPVKDKPSYRASQAEKEDYTKYLIRKTFRSSFKDRKVYFNWHSDYRGRMYSGGYFFNPQGNKYEKSIITLAQKEKHTFAGEVQLKLALARAYGLDKHSDRYKLNWFNKNKNNLKNMVFKEQHIANRLFIALDDLENQRESNIAIELDATNSQLQIASVLMKDRDTARTCNVINNDNDTIADAYKETSKTMKQILKHKYNLDVNLKREHVKKTLMISGYGASDDRLKIQLKKDLGELYNDHIFEAFQLAQKIVTPAMTKFKELSLSIWKNYCSDKKLITWTLPDGFEVQFRPTEVKRYTLPIYGIDIDVHIRVNEPEERSVALGVNIIHSVDAYIAREMIRRCNRAGFNIYTIHDGFFAHPNHAFKLRNIYREILAEINESRLLEDILSEITGEEFIKINNNISKKEILSSRYAIS